MTNIELETMALIKSACKAYIVKANRKKQLKTFTDIATLEKFANNVDVDNVVSTPTGIILTYYEK